MSCPLCFIFFADAQDLKMHMFYVHGVNNRLNGPKDRLVFSV